MDFRSEAERRNDAVAAEHKEALARGEKRVLRTTATGELYSYAGDEIGFSPGRGQAQIKTWWGMGIVSAVLTLLFFGSCTMFLLPLWRGGQLYWCALFLIALAGFGALFTLGLARDEYRATKVRKVRGAPKPGSRWEAAIDRSRPASTRSTGTGLLSVTVLMTVAVT